MIPEDHPSTPSKSPELLAFEAKARELGHPESAIDSGTDCTHQKWSFSQHGRYCPCGAVMMDMGD